MNRPLMIVAAGIVAIGAAIGLSLWSHHGEDAPTPPDSAGGNGGQPALSDKSDTQSRTPSFDVVRINPEGETVIAGRALPHAEVVILDGDKEIGRVVADNRGEWVLVPANPLPPGNRELSLKASNPDGTSTASDAPVVLAVPDRTGNKNAALAVKVNRDGSIDILQGPDMPAAPGPLAISGIRYDGEGHLSVMGSSAAGAWIQLYLDGRPLTRIRADAEGHWKAMPRPALTPGSHVVRADQIGSDGAVAGRAEITFSLPESLPSTGGRVVVEPGNSLWRIARKAYGDGTDFMVIFAANKDQIRDPNLIYPGQVFNIPPR